MTPPRRKKWTEVEERTLIDKYNEMVSNGTLAKMKTREKKFKPIAYYVNNLHNVCDPVTFPWQWTWKDVSTKVQNMRHQYLLVKQKIKKPSSDSCSEEFDWLEGLTHWSNFVRYKEVFGDVPLGLNGNENENGADGGVEIGELGRDMGDGDFGMGLDEDGGEGDDGMLGLGFEYDTRDLGENYSNHNENGEVMRKDADSGFEYEEDANESTMRKKKKIARGMEKKVLGFFARQLNELKKMETQFEQREAEREQERQRRDSFLMELELERVQRLEKCREEREKAREELRKQRKEQWEAFEEESVARKRRREEELNNENEWEERMNRRRSDWMKRMDEMLSQHRAEMVQVQARMLHEQQNLTSQFLGMVGQWTGHTALLSDPTGQHSQYISQMMQNMHQESGIIRDDTVDEGDNQDDHFVVD